MTPGDWLGRIEPSAFRAAVRRWFRRHGRELPWRRTRDPYAIWVSEIMLQQTQVATVLGYYQRFLDRFPTVAALAEAKESDVLHAWQGLGYYRRARMMHQAARQIALEHEGRFPTQLAQIARLPGLGRYTAGAIVSFAFDQRAPILEANTLRLWTRLCGAEGNPARAPLSGELWRLAESILPRTKPGDFNQALMDLGATVCTSRSPACGVCPVSGFCEARAQDRALDFPTKELRPAPVDAVHAAAVVRAGDRVLVRRRPPGGRWGGLWEFPRAEVNEGETPERAARRAVKEISTAPFELVGPPRVLRHGIMHFRVRLVWFLAAGTVPRGRGPRAGGIEPENGMARWQPIDLLEDLAFSSPQRRIIAALRASGELAGSPSPGGRRPAREY